ncbi:5-(carboxyamino)imidazole ribonucleotide mutase [Aliiglaciecola sp. LCG003]|uniref:5-(carboxyamino)imidazole ribonucleotide mutase n=1 Tax=Aliiglaciecola sp. LCG003 TaxID=3053655 RepID=UPI002572EA86|nr:5-(carboxyamino)imidazole ribonucleotide mutase [Aliiglaciecola sp. LCG003]WJG09875.1 5-(carboxyamino)imidazole ribonucleotide mutase [Aliiglaciecola sp. LCG003]
MPKVAIVMGSKSDWPTMQQAAIMLKNLGVDYDAKVVSAHRTPDLLTDFAKEAADQGYHVIIGGAGGAAHLPGMIAAHTHLPVFGVPVRSSQLNGMDSLLSIVQMPKGVAVGTLAIGEAGAANAGLLAAQVIALHDSKVADAIKTFRQTQTDTVLALDELELPE